MKTKIKKKDERFLKELINKKFIEAEEKRTQFIDRLLETYGIDKSETRLVDITTLQYEYETNPKNPNDNVLTQDYYLCGILVGKIILSTKVFPKIRIEIKEETINLDCEIKNDIIDMLETYRNIIKLENEMNLKYKDRRDVQIAKEK